MVTILLFNVFFKHCFFFKVSKNISFENLKYTILGPSKWNSICTTARSQSPINIESDISIPNENLTKFERKDLTKPTAMKMTNNGHSS